MRPRGMFPERLSRLAPLAAVLVLAAGCVDLDIANLNEPDRDRAVARAGDVEALIAGSFAEVYALLHSLDGPPPGAGGTGAAAQIFPNHATEMTTTSNGYAARENVREPRFALDNDASIGSTTGPWGPRRAWVRLNRAVSSANDGLRIIDERGTTITEGGQDVTPRATAFARFIQGVGWGYMSLIFDQGYHMPEDLPVSAFPIEQARNALTPAAALREQALEALDGAIAIAQQHSFTFPSFTTSRLYFATPNAMTSAEFIQLASTMAARILVYHARTPEERREVDWTRVLQYTANGLTYDFETVLESGFRTSTLYQNAQNNAVGCGTCYRLDNRLIGQADVSGAYQAWINGPLGDRNRFDIVTPDRRITGATPQSHGAYTRYRPNDNGFLAGVGLYLFSAYQWARHAHGLGLADDATGSSSGSALLATADENRLLRAEALLRTGNLAGAAELINVTRTRAHTLPDGVTYPGLPAVTAAGVPESANCVPRTDSGACGDLMVALRYERMIEGIALDTVRGYFDSRGFGLLPDDSWVQAPVPGGELVVLDLPNYTFGGPGGPGSAVYRPVTMQDL